ncbi:hypothetical protein EVAR_90234_1 [Eumeta japonica]|uniref:Uncharacterized protein n=1 Tax=Eumeta variegata TaxID=151549 RepID=A0A4C1YN73_EUMVA|nr:hypothetical protein EVAR_90234_1 [Eumeta japonica]
MRGQHGGIGAADSRSRRRQPETSEVAEIPNKNTQKIGALPSGGGGGAGRVGALFITLLKSPLAPRSGLYSWTAGPADIPRRRDTAPSGRREERARTPRRQVAESRPPIARRFGTRPIDRDCEAPWAPCTVISYRTRSPRKGGRFDIRARRCRRLPRCSLSTHAPFGLGWSNALAIFILATSDRTMKK